MSGRTHRFFRATGFEQFIYQRDPSGLALGQQLLFYEPPDEHWSTREKVVRATTQLAARLRGETGAGANELFAILVLLWSHIRKEKKLLRFSASETAKVFKGDVEVHQRVLESMSVPLHDAKSFVSNGRFHSRILQFTEQSPFVRKPLLALPDGTFVPTSLGVFAHYMNGCVAHLLTGVDRQKFGEAYGYIQESHVGRGLRHLGFDVVEEAELGRDLPEEARVADFACACVDGIRLVVDSKGVAPSAWSQVDPTSEIEEKELRNSLVKGMEQCVETAFRLDERAPAVRQLLMVVTREDFFLASGPRFWREHLGEPLQLRMGDVGIPADFVGPQDVFVVCLADFDLWVGSCKTPKDALAVLLNAAKANVTAAERPRLQDHIPEPCARPPYVKDASDRMFAEVERRIATVDET